MSLNFLLMISFMFITYVQETNYYFKIKNPIICDKNGPLCIDDSNSLTSFDAFSKETERRCPFTPFRMTFFLTKFNTNLTNSIEY